MSKYQLEQEVWLYKFNPTGHYTNRVKGLDLAVWPENVKSIISVKDIGRAYVRYELSSGTYGEDEIYSSKNALLEHLMTYLLGAIDDE